MSETIISPGVFQAESDQSPYTLGPQVVGAAIVGPTVHGVPLVPRYVTSYSEYQSVYGEIFKSGSNYFEYFTSLAAKDYFNNGGKTLLVTRIISGTNNLNTYASSSVTAQSGSSTSFTLETISWGDQMNNTGVESGGALVSGSAQNVRWEVTNVSTGSGVFTIVVRRGDDNNSTKNVLETWANLSLDPQQNNYISRVIGDLKPVADLTNNQVIYTGSYDNASQYIRIASVVVPNVDSLDNLGIYKAAQYSGSLPLVGSGSFDGGARATNLAQKMNETITTTNIQGFANADYTRALSLLTNKDDYQFNLLIAPGIGLDNSTSTSIISTAENRTDAIALVDTGVFGTSVASAVTNAAGNASSYGATYFPWVQLYSSTLGKVVWCPPTTIIPGVFAFNDSVSAEWFAPAGMNRGGIPSVIRAERKLQQSDRDTLYLGNINPISTIPGSGIAVLGQKTLQRKPTALDRINVRRLLIELKGKIGSVARTLLFEQNTATTRNRFLSQVNPYLESVVQRQGLYAFQVKMDDTNNTADVIDRNQLVGTILIQPTKTSEFIILTFNILPTGASFE